MLRYADRAICWMRELSPLVCFYLYILEHVGSCYANNRDESDTGQKGLGHSDTV